MHYTLAELAEMLSARLVLKGQAAPLIGALKTLQHAKAGDLSFFANAKYKHHLSATQATAVIISEEALDGCPTHALVMANPYLGFAKIAALFDRTPHPIAGIHPTAVIAEGCEIADSVSIGAYAVLGKGVKIGPGVSIGAHCVLSDFVSIGEGTVLKPHVTLYHEVQVGKRCILHSGSVIGSDGFGMANDRGRWVKIPQLGSVILHDEVEIGANTTVDRGAIENTEIHEGVKIDNQVQIAHNVVIGAHTAMAAKVGIAGSTTVGKYCLLGGGVGLNGHIQLTDQVMVTAMSIVLHSIDQPGTYSSTLPAKPQREWAKTLARINRLDKMAEQFKDLKQRLAVLIQGKSS